MITDMDENNGGGGKRLLSRPREGRLAAGVCIGLANYLGVDVNLVRLGFGVFTVFWGLGALIYALAWLVLPAEGETGSILGSLVGKLRL
jgi:phage shock protein C